MEKNPNGPDAYPPPPRYDQALSQPTGYPSAPPQQVGYAGQPGAPGYGPQPGATGQPGPPGYGAQPGVPGQPGGYEAPGKAGAPGPGVVPGYHLQSGTSGYGGYPPQPGYATQPGYVVQQSGYPAQPGLQQTTQITIVRQRPNNYLGLSIFVCLCCCLPFGIIGIVYSSESISRFDRGDDVGAAAAASSARSWSMAGLVCGVILITIYIILQVTVFATSSYSGY